MHFSAAAASTPSGAPPEPMYMSMPVFSRLGAVDHAGDVAVGDQPDARAGRALISAMSACVARPLRARRP